MTIIIFCALGHVRFFIRRGTTQYSGKEMFLVWRVFSRHFAEALPFHGANKEGIFLRREHEK